MRSFRVYARAQDEWSENGTIVTRINGILRIVCENFKRKSSGTTREQERVRKSEKYLFIVLKFTEKSSVTTRKSVEKAKKTEFLKPVNYLYYKYVTWKSGRWELKN